MNSYESVQKYLSHSQNAMNSTRNAKIGSSIPFIFADKYYVYLVTVAGRKYRKARMQMFSSARNTLKNAEVSSEAIISGMPKIIGAADAIEDAAGDAKRTLHSIGDVAMEAKTLLNNINTALTPVSIKWEDFDLVPLLLKIARIVINLSLARSGARLASFLFNVATEFGSEVVQIIKNALFTDEEVQLNPRYKQARKQGILDQVTTMAKVREWMVENGKLTTTSLALSLYAILNCSLGLPKGTMDTEKALAFFGNRCKNLKSITDFAKSSWNMFSDLADWIIDSIFPTNFDI